MATWTETKTGSAMNFEHKKKGCTLSTTFKFFHNVFAGKIPLLLETETTGKTRKNELPIP